MLSDRTGLKVIFKIIFLRRNVKCAPALPTHFKLFFSFLLLRDRWDCYSRKYYFSDLRSHTNFMQRGHLDMNYL